jgi:hypothetical protein
VKNEHDNSEEIVQLPEPTGWPIITAFGLALLFAGVVTSPFVSLVGIVVGIFGAIGWFSDVYPHPRHEAVSVADDTGYGVEVASRSVRHLKAGEKGHRVRLPVEIHPYSSGLKGGLAGAVAMAILACAWGLWKYDSIWYPINVLAAAGVPELALASNETLSQFSPAGLIVGSIAHITISVMVGLLYAVLLPMLPARFEWFWGGIVTPIIWSALVLAGLHIVDPRLADIIDWVPFVICQVAFGMVGGYVVFKSAKIETMQTWPLAAKLGVEAEMESKEPKEPKP